MCIHCKYVSISLSSCKWEYMCLDMCIYVSICLNMGMYAFISLSVFTGTCMSLSPGFYPAVCLYTLVHVSISLPVCIHLYAHVCIFYQSAHAHLCLFQFFCISVHAHVCKKASFYTHYVVSRGPNILLNLHLHLTLCM